MWGEGHQSISARPPLSLPPVLSNRDAYIAMAKLHHKWRLRRLVWQAKAGRVSRLKEVAPVGREA